MNVNVRPDAVMHRLRRSLPLRHASLLPLCFFLFIFAGLSLSAPARAQQGDARSEAQVVVITDLLQSTVPDYVSIRVLGNTDQAVLDRIVQTLAEKLRTRPEQVTYTKDNVDFPDDKGLAISFNGIVIPRNAEYLPIGPFVEAFAPYAKRVRIAYAFKGHFKYRGYLGRYSDKDVAFTVTYRPSVNPAEQTEVYNMDIAITNPTLTTVSFLNYPEQGKKSSAWKSTRLALAVGAAIIILALGLFLSQLLPRRKESVSTGEETTNDEISTGGTHD